MREAIGCVYVCVCIYIYVREGVGCACVCACVYVYIYAYLYIYTHKLISLSPSITKSHTLSRTHKYARGSVFLCVCFHVCLHICLHICSNAMHVSLHMFAFLFCAYACVHIHTYKNIYTKTHIHTHAQNIHIHTPGDAMSHRDGLGREVVLSACPVCSRVAAPKKKDTLSCQKSPII